MPTELNNYNSQIDSIVSQISQEEATHFIANNDFFKRSEYIDGDLKVNVNEFSDNDNNKGFSVYFRTTINDVEYVKIYGEGICQSYDWNILPDVMSIIHQ